MFKEALYWHEVGDTKVSCDLCPNGCVLNIGQTGICGVRANVGGKLVTKNYGRISSFAVDPVEKKPLFHVDPGSYLFSLGSFGCNLKCRFCQNWTISQDEPPCKDLSPEMAVNLGLKAKTAEPKVLGMAYTYNEPGVMYEFVRECAETAKEKGLKNVLVSNGYIKSKPLKELLPFLDALNIDVKGFTDDFYKEMVSGRLGPVKASVEEACKKAWVEITYLVIPGRNDSPRTVAKLARWLSEINPSIPLHLSRYFPNYLMDAPETPIRTLEDLRETAKGYLNYVYLGNVWKRGFSDTYCPSCHTPLIERGALEVERASLTQEGQCPSCGRPFEMAGKAWI